jgi:hypothetical protein
MRILKWFLWIAAVLVIIAAGLLWFIGAFDQVKVSEQQVGPFTYAYEKFVGPYQNSGAVFTNVYKILKEASVESTRGIGIYYDDPKTVAAAKLRSDCGAIIELKDIRKLRGKLLISRLGKKNCVVAELPIKTMFSYMIGPAKAYPTLINYAKARALKTAMVFELYDMPHNKILYVMEINK